MSKTYKEFTSGEQLDEVVGKVLKGLAKVIGGELSAAKDMLKDSGKNIDAVEGKEQSGLPKGN